MCHHHQTSPESPFTRRIICSQATPGGRFTISDNRFIRTLDGVKEELELAGADEVRIALEKHFGINWKTRE
jgi:N-hydroxyarylamine O-acetyltransferase